MRFTLFVLVFLTGCMAVPVNNTIETLKTTASPFAINKNLEDTWTKAIVLLSSEGYKIVSKDKSDGFIVAEVKNAPITYFDAKGKEKKDTNALGITDMRMRINNYNKVYPRTANLQYSIMLSKAGEDSTTVLVTLNENCTVTSFFENTFIRKKTIPKVRITSSGLFEKRIVGKLKGE